MKTKTAKIVVQTGEPELRGGLVFSWGTGWDISDSGALHVTYVHPQDKTEHVTIFNRDSWISVDVASPM